MLMADTSTLSEAGQTFTSNLLAQAPGLAEGIAVAKRVARQSGPRGRIASAEMLPWADLLPHVICSPPVFAGGGGHEADQHDDTGRVGSGIGGSLRPG